MNNLSTAYEKTFTCVQCGMCLPTCPTYITLKEEKHSPRGRINLLKMYAVNQLSLEDIREGIEVCLGCMECQTVCPTQVDYGYIYHTAVEMLKENEKKTNPVKYYGMKQLFKSTLNNKISLKLIDQSVYRTQVLTEKIPKLLNLLPKKERQFLKSLPEIEHGQPSKKESQTSSLTVAYFKGCIMDGMFKEVNERAITILKNAGVNVIEVGDEVCCGALQNHAGYSDDAKRNAMKNITTFENIECDYIVNAIGGCGATLKEYPLLFDKTETEWKQKAQDFSDKNVDISLILEQLNLNYQQLNYHVTYQPSCHLRNVQKVFDAPTNIIKTIPGITYTELQDKNICCGSAGIYNIMQYDTSMKILDKKMNDFKQTKANVIVTSNPGCYIQMKLGLERDNIENVKVMHLVDLVYEALGEE